MDGVDSGSMLNTKEKESSRDAFMDVDETCKPYYLGEIEVYIHSYNFFIVLLHQKIYNISLIALFLTGFFQ
jgi:hypothetical protein